MSKENITEEEKAKTLEAVKAIQQRNGDKEFVLATMRENPLMGPVLSLLSEELRGDKEVVLEAMKLNINQFRYISEELQQDGEFIAEVEKMMKESIQEIRREEGMPLLTKEQLADMIKPRLRISEVQEVIAETEQKAKNLSEKEERTNISEKEI